MANPDKEVVGDMLDIARQITNFLYTDGKGRNGVKDDINLEDCTQLLQRLERRAYDSYEYAANFLGWVDN